MSCEAYSLGLTALTKGPKTNLAAGVMITIGPVKVTCSAMVICMQQFVHKRMVDLLLAVQLIVANSDLGGRGL